MTTLITICAIIQRAFGQNNRRQQPRVQTVVAYAHVFDEFFVSLTMGAPFVVRSGLDGRVHFKSRFDG